MRRRQFITLLGGAAAWPLAARAQQGDRVRRIGVLIASTADDPEAQARIAAFTEALSQLGWTDGRNVRIDVRWATTNADGLRRHADELVALLPDVIVAATGTATVAPLLQATRNAALASKASGQHGDFNTMHAPDTRPEPGSSARAVPIVFAVVIDPVGAGFVASLARPGGNATGFTIFEYGLSGKWLELLKQVAPGTTRAAVLRDPTIASGIGQFAAIQAVAPSLGVELTPVDVRDAPEIERAVTAFASAALASEASGQRGNSIVRSPDARPEPGSSARGSNGGLIVTANALASRHRDLIITLAARHRLPAVYAWRYFAADGGLISYGPDLFDQYRRAAGYVDRILRGEKPADLPVQAPTRYELVINLKTAKALGIDIPTTLLTRADEVIE